MLQADGTGDKPPIDRAPESGRYDFAAHFQGSYRIFWLIAAGIVRDPQAAEDVVQESAVIAYSKRDLFQPGTSFTAWVAQTVRFVALNHARRRTRDRAVNLEAVEEQLTQPFGNTKARRHSIDTMGNMAQDQEMFDDRITNALKSVSDIARACLLLRTVESLEYSEIARLLDIPQGTAMSHVHRARTYLRERLSGTEVVAGARNGRHA